MARTSAGGIQPNEIQDAIHTYAEDAEASDSYAITLEPAPSAYTAGQMFVFKANTANTGAASLDVNGLGAKTIKKRTGTDLANNDIQSGSIVSVVYDGTNFQMISMLANAPAGSGDMVAATYDPAGVTEQLVGLTAIQTLTNKTLTSPVLNTGVSGTAVLDEDNMASNSATQLATQQSIKAYVDNTALLDSEVTNLAAVKAFDPTDYATAAQGALADSAVQTETDPVVGAVSGIVKANGAGTISAAVEDTDYQGVLSEGAFVDGDKTKLDGIEASADVTDTANVTAAGALMDSEVTNLAAVKAFDPTDYVAATGDTMEGDLAMGDFDITGAGSISFTQQLDNGSKTASFSVDFSTDNHQKATLTANTMTITFDTTSIGVGVYTLMLVNPGLATITWAGETGSVYWADGTEPTWTSSGTDIISVFFDGTNFYCQAGQAFA